MRRPILRFGETLLHQPAKPVQEFSDELQILIDDMIETMYRAPGVGLAAPQVGVPWRVFVIDLSVGQSAKELVVMINPEFRERDGMQLDEEGCLSVPGFAATVARPSRIVAAGLSRDGRPVTVEGTELLARALQHEMDHLDGRLFLDRLPRLQRRSLIDRIERLDRSGRW